MTRHRTWNIVVFAALALVVLVGPSLLAQASDAVKSVAGVPASGPSETSEWGSSVVWAFLSSSLLEWLKRNRSVSLISDRTAFAAQRAIGVLVAFGTGMGIHASFVPDQGVLTVSGLLWPSIWTAGGESLRQWVLQEITYRTAIKPYHKDSV